MGEQSYLRSYREPMHNEEVIQECGLGSSVTTILCGNGQLMPTRGQSLSIPLKKNTLWIQREELRMELGHMLMAQLGYLLSQFVSPSRTSLGSVPGPSRGIQTCPDCLQEAIIQTLTGPNLA